MSEARAGPDPDLLRRFMEGEPAAVARVESLVKRVVRFRGYYIPAEERVDLVQEVLLDVWQAVHEQEFALHKSLDALARSVSYRTCVDWVRRRRPTAAVDPETPDVTQSPDRRALERERILLGRQVLRELRQPCRELFGLFVVGGSSHRDIAERQGRTEGAVRTQLAQCLKEARELLDRVRRRHGAATWRPRSPA